MRGSFAVVGMIRFSKRVLGILGLGVLALPLLGFTGCENRTLGSLDPDFLLTVDESKVAFPQGHSASVKITIAPLNGFSGDVDLEVTLSSTDLTATLEDRSLAIGGRASTTLVIRAKLETPPGAIPRSWARRAACSINPSRSKWRSRGWLICDPSSCCASVG